MTATEQVLGLLVYLDEAALTEVAHVAHNMAWDSRGLRLTADHAHGERVGG